MKFDAKNKLPTPALSYTFSRTRCPFFWCFEYLNIISGKGTAVVSEVAPFSASFSFCPASVCLVTTCCWKPFFFVWQTASEFGLSEKRTWLSASHWSLVRIHLIMYTPTYLSDLWQFSSVAVIAWIDTRLGILWAATCFYMLLMKSESKRVGTEAHLLKAFYFLQGSVHLSHLFFFVCLFFFVS